jgi:ferredoxin/flavodoxin
MKIIVFYFSGTGNTWWISREFANIANNSNHVAEFISIEKEEAQSVEYLQKNLLEADALGIAYPIYGSTAPKIVWEFIEQLKEVSKQKNHRAVTRNTDKFGFILTTMALFSGDGALVLRDEMEELGFPLRGAINFKLASNISIPGFHFDPVDKEKLEKRKKKAKKDLKSFFNKLILGKKKLEGRWNLLGKLGGWIQRKFMDWTLERYINWSADMDKCTKCELCINNCPTENILLNEGEIKFLDKCTYCMRCYNFCPTYAISPREEFADPKEYKRHRGCTENFNLEPLQK